MNIQNVIVWPIVALASVYLLRQAWRTWSGRKAGCGAGCHCGAKPPAPAGQATLIPIEQLTLRRN